MPSVALGIDFGTTYSAVGYLSDAGVVLVPIDPPKRLVRSAVYVTEDDRVVVGEEAFRLGLSDPFRLIRGIKPCLGDPEWECEIGESVFTAVGLAGQLVRRLKEVAEQAVGPVERAVLSAPSFFDDELRKTLINVGHLAGFSDVDVLDLPSAVVTAHQVDPSGPVRRVLVFHLGGGTLDIAVMEVGDGRVEPLSAVGDLGLGGQHWDRRLIRYAAEEVRSKHEVDPRRDPAVRTALEMTCERVKRRLSRRQSATIQVDWEGVSEKVPIERDQFEEMTRDLVARCEMFVQRALGDAGLRAGDIDQVLLSGGATMMPMVRAAVNRVTDSVAHSATDPTLVAAVGAAVAAAGGTHVQWHVPRGERLVSVTSEGTSVSDHTPRWFGGIGMLVKRGGRRTLQVLIPGATSVPCNRSVVLKPARACRHLRVHLVTPDSNEPERCTPIGDYIINRLFSSERLSQNVRLRVGVNMDGEIAVEAIEEPSGEELGIYVEEPTSGRSDSGSSGLYTAQDD